MLTLTRPTVPFFLLVETFTKGERVQTHPWRTATNFPSPSAPPLPLFFSFSFFFLFLHGFSISPRRFSPFPWISRFRTRINQRENFNKKRVSLHAGILQFYLLYDDWRCRGREICDSSYERRIIRLLLDRHRVSIRFILYSLFRYIKCLFQFVLNPFDLTFFNLKLISTWIISFQRTSQHGCLCE